MSPTYTDQPPLPDSLSFDERQLTLAAWHEDHGRYDHAELLRITVQLRHISQIRAFNSSATCRCNQPSCRSCAPILVLRRRKQELIKQLGME